MPVHAHHAAVGLEPEGIAQSRQQGRTSVVVDDRFGDRAAERNHAGREQGGHAARSARRTSLPGTQVYCVTGRQRASARAPRGPAVAVREPGEHRHSRAPPLVSQAPRREVALLGAGSGPRPRIPLGARRPRRASILRRRALRMEACSRLRRGPSQGDERQVPARAPRVRSRRAASRARSRWPGGRVRRPGSWADE